MNGVKYSITSQNYVVNFGNLTQTQPSIYMGYAFGGAPFTDIGSPDSIFSGLYTSVANTEKRTYGFQVFTDGTSNTMLASELRVPQGYDLRGFSWWGLGSCYTAWQTPNSSLPDIVVNASYCKYPLGNNPPCQVATSALPMMLAARSFHPGGVNVTFGDGSVRFIKNSVNVFIWRALSTTHGNEVISADAY